MQRVSNKPVLSERVLTSSRREILEWLGKYRFGTTSQIWQELQPEKYRQHTLNELETLRDLGLVVSAPLEPAKGTASEFYWQLRKAGAKAANIPYGSHYARRPTPELVHFRDLQLKLLREVEYAEWLLVKPVAYSPTRPLPDPTPQYHILAQVVETSAKRDIERARQMGQLDRQQVINFEDREHLRVIPKQFNDYLAYQPEDLRAAVLILCPPGIGTKFWQRRVAKYGRLLKRIPVYAVFETERLVDYWNKELAASGLKTIAVCQLYERLKGLEVGVGKV